MYYLTGAEYRAPFVKHLIKSVYMLFKKVKLHQLHPPPLPEIRGHFK